MPTMTHEQALNRIAQLETENGWLCTVIGEPQDDDYVPGCGEYDTQDSKGQPLRPRFNDAGEPWWM